MAEVVVVDYDYTAKEPDELTIKKGDIIREVVKKPGGWWEGVLDDRKGMFPDNFVRASDKDAVTYRNRKDSARIRQCRVVFSYKQDHPDELNLNVGDVINILGEEEEGWWKGTMNGREGVFPSNFVEEIKSKPGSREDLVGLMENDKTPTLPPKPSKTLCQVKFTYIAQNEDELTIKEGDIINLVSKDGQDVGWWKGELKGRTGVFPDNFVTLITEGDIKNHVDDRKATCKTPEPLISKTPVVSMQRKSLEIEADAGNRIPPIPSKKPTIPVKKSPTGSNSQGGLLAGLRKKLVDVVDGATGSKSQPVLIKATDVREDGKIEVPPENAFDQVERTPMLLDVRATRAKAPGRRPPSVVFKEGEPGIVNGNTDHALLDSLTEQFINSRASISSNEDNEVKPRVREWEKHKAPWLEEMKLNQAKRTTIPPGPEQSKLKLTPSDKSASPEIDEAKSNKTSPFERTNSSPVDMSKSMSAISPKLKAPESVVLRSKPQPIPQSSVRPQSVAVTNLNEKHFGNVTTTTSPKISLPVNNKISPNNKPIVLQKEMKGGGDFCAFENVSLKQYEELLLRIEKLECVVEQQHRSHRVAIEELQGKLQVETDMRRMLQAELDKVSQCVLQV